MIYLKKKSNYSDFFIKISANHLSLSAYFSILCQEISKLSSSVLWRGFEIKSQQKRTHYLKCLRNGGQLPAKDVDATPLPALIRVNTVPHSNDF